jgi:hypothetical protein
MSEVTNTPTSGGGGRVVLDPTGEQTAAERTRAARPDRLEGLDLALLDISKARGDVFLNRLEEALSQRGARVRRYSKPTFTKPAPIDLRRQIASECAAVVEALAD